MSVTSCEFISSVCQDDANKYATYKATWQIITDNKTDGPALIRAHPGLPQSGDGYSTPYGDADSAAKCILRDFGLPEEKETTRVWRPVLTYTTNPASLPLRDPGDPPTLPWNEKPQIELYAVKDKEAVLFDLNGRIIASSAGEPYDPVQERDRTKFMIRISRNVQFADVAFNASYRDAINSDPFFGCDVDTVKVETPGAMRRLWFGSIPYYNETWEFAVNTQGWVLRLYDYGMYRKVGTGETAKLELLRDLHGHPLNAPRLLNGSGGVNAIGASPVFIVPNPLVPAADWFDIYERKPFGLLGLPQFI